MKVLHRLFLAGLLALFVAGPLAARQLVIQRFDAQILINPDGTIDVTENITAHFIGTDWHGLYRTIPVEYTTPEGLNYTLFVTVLSIADSDGNKLKYDRSQQGRNMKLKVYVPEADNSTRTVVITYRVLDAISFFDDHDELYWNVTGTDWDVPLNSVTAQITLPNGVTGLHAIAYTGVFASRRESSDVEVKDDMVEIQTTRPLGFHEGLTAVVGFDKGFVHPPSAAARISLFLRSNWPFFLPICVFGVMFYLYWTRGRDPEHGSITVQYDPPDNLTPGECGTLVDNEASMRDITATLVDLAVKGFIVIEQKDQSGLLGLTHHRDYVFHLKKPPAQWNDLRPHERAMLGGLFFGGDPVLTTAVGSSGVPPSFSGIQDYSVASGDAPSGSTPPAVAPPPVIEDYSAAFRGTSGFGAAPQASVALSELQNRFYTQLPPIRSCIFDALMSDGYYLHRPDTVRQAYIGSGIVLGILLIVGGSWLSAQTGVAQSTWTLTGVVSGLLICVFGWFMPARTISGWRTLKKLLGFEEFLGRVEKDQIERLEKSPDLFEKYLPFAMALRVEKKWVQAFSGIALQPPQWYQGHYGGAFVPYIFVNDLNMMSMQAGNVMASAPRSSSGGLGGSGFGGGGGVGGGFGGGGGGGF